MKSKKIWIILVLIIVLISTLFYVKTRKEYSNDSGTIIVNVYDINENLIVTKEFDFFIGDDLPSLIQNNFENVKYKEDFTGKVILSIDKIETDFINSYIKIMVDGKYSNKGISLISLKDGLVIDFIETSIV